MNGPSDPQLNATPLIDVLLVMLVMLVLTLPLATHAVTLNVPQPTAGSPPATLTLQLEFDGQLYWNGVSLPREQLEARLRQLAASAHPPRLEVLPDKRAPYDSVAHVLAAAQRSGIRNLTVPPIS